MNLAKEHELLMAVPYQVSRAGAAKGLSAPQIRQRLQQAGLAGGVRTVNQVEIRGQMDLDTLETAEVSGPE